MPRDIRDACPRWSARATAMRREPSMTFRKQHRPMRTGHSHERQFSSVSGETHPHREDARSVPKETPSAH
eukprot:6276316-Alexandrium_andersonii.AAC.1